VRSYSRAPAAALEAIQAFLHLETSAGFMLAGAALLALIVANTPLLGPYLALLDLPVEIRFGPLQIAKPFLLWINDGLMAIFFLLVGLEIKREVLDGELSSAEQLALPLAAALGGMVLPALIYASLNWRDAIGLRGWAIPAATDIAFALGALALVGARVPLALKVFLTALAVIDDLGAILIIAIFYTENLSFLSLALAAAGLAVLAAMNLAGVVRTSAYVLVGVILWVCVLKSGVHATLAGVALGLAIPLQAEDEEGHSPLRHLEHKLHPWVAYAILPVFAFANAGLPLRGLSLANLYQGVPLGIAAGLFVGKQLGVFGLSLLVTRLGIARMPEGANLLGLYGVSLLAGIGFTMSLFIGSLAFAGYKEDYTYALKLGVLAGSLASGLVGYLILRIATARAPAPAAG
jgi:NhaA family Na+:H+ antiporter